jgi:hypothetical protein
MDEENGLIDKNKNYQVIIKKTVVAKYNNHNKLVLR